MDFNFDFSDSNEENKIIALSEDELYEIVIIGGGPAAMTAAVYCMRKGLNAAMITKNVGGQVIDTKEVENYMGYKYIQGSKLVDKFNTQVKQFSIAFQEGISVNSLSLDGDIKILETSDNKKYKAKAVIIASGATWRELSIPGEHEFRGLGVSYCTTCDAPFFKKKKVAVVGGGNSGIEAAIDLAKLAKEVKIIEYTDKLKADKILVEKLKAYDNISILTSKESVEIKGQDYVKSLVLKNRLNDKIEEVELDGVFVEIGTSPNSNFVKNVLNLNKAEEIIIDCGCKTNIEGVFAAGDVSSVPFKQIIVAAGEGAKAALSAYDYVMKF